MGIVVEPIGTVRSTRREVRDDGWDAETSAIVLTERSVPRRCAGSTRSATSRSCSSSIR